MEKRLTVAILLAVLITPSLALADADLIQESCEIIPGTSTLLITFTIVNFSLPVEVCDLHFLPEPQPPLPECTLANLGVPTGWSGFLNPFGGGDWFANTLDDCIAPGTSLGGFEIEIDIEPETSDFCCYIVQFTGPNGAVLLETEACFSCMVVPNEATTWGSLKGQYR